MRKTRISIVAGMVLIFALMAFADTSMAIGPDVVDPKAPVRLGDESEPPFSGRNISFRGVIDSFPSDPPYTGSWDIETDAGEMISVEVTDDTEILPPGVTPEVGDSAHVLARSEGSEGEETLVALKITVEKAQSRWGYPQHFRGEIEALPADSMTGTWQVSGTSFTVDAETMIHPPDVTPELGMVANVVAFEQSDGTLWALNIVLQTPEKAAAEVILEGTIEDLPDDEGFVGTWIVDGISVTVTEDTKLKGVTPAVDLIAEVEGTGSEEDGITATKIRVKDPACQVVEFEGELMDFTDTRPSVWVIQTNTGEISVTVTSSTTTNTDRGLLEVGCWVEVKALQQPDGLVAMRIKVEGGPSEKPEIEFTAQVIDLPSPDCDPVWGHWIFEEYSVVVTPHTEINGLPEDPDQAVEEGLFAEVRGVLQGYDGFVYAESITIIEQ